MAKKAKQEFNPSDEAVRDGEHIPFEDLEYAEEEARLAGAPHASVQKAPPLNNPYLSEEDQGMEMKSAIVGPPSYGSPDPVTSAGKLLPLDQHPLNAAALPEGHPAAIDEDYGKGYETTLVAGRPERTDLERHLVGDRTNEGNDEVDATESARDLANSEGVDLNDVEGSGEDGRVTKPDVENYIAERDSGD